MIEVKNGRLTGTVEIPVEDLSVFAVLKYGDLTEYTPTEIGNMLGVETRRVRDAVGNLHKAGYHVVLARGKSGSIKGQKKMNLKQIEQHNGFQGKLVRLMLANHENCSSLSRQIGVNCNTVWRWVKKDVVPDMRNLKKVADHYNVQMAWLTGETRNPMRRY